MMYRDILATTSAIGNDEWMDAIQRTTHRGRRAPMEAPHQPWADGQPRASGTHGA